MLSKGSMRRMIVRSSGGSCISCDPEVGKIALVDGRGSVGCCTIKGPAHFEGSCIHISSWLLGKSATVIPSIFFAFGRGRRWHD